MKGLFILFALAIFSPVAFAQRVKRKGTTPIELNKNASAANSKKQSFTIDQVQGKWQEQERVGIAAGNKLDFTDTLMVNIDKNKGEVREGMSMNMKGDAAIEEGDDLYLAGDSYSIRSVGNGLLVLDDGEFVRTMKQVKVFYLETVGKDSIKHLGFTPQNILPDNIYGKWVVYRREAKPGIINNETELVKSILIEKASSDGQAKGEIVVYSKNLSEKLDCFITLKNDNMEVITKNKSWNFKTYLADNNEFVFGEADQVMHYAKRQAASPKALTE